MYSKILIKIICNMQQKQNLHIKHDTTTFFLECKHKKINIIF